MDRGRPPAARCPAIGHNRTLAGLNSRVPRTRNSPARKTDTVPAAAPDRGWRTTGRRSPRLRGRAGRGDRSASGARPALPLPQRRHHRARGQRPSRCGGASARRDTRWIRRAIASNPSALTVHDLGCLFLGYPRSRGTADHPYSFGSTGRDAARDSQASRNSATKRRSDASSVLRVTGTGVAGAEVRELDDGVRTSVG